MITENLPLRKILLAFIVFIVAIFVIIKLYIYLTSGYISVTTGSSDYVQIQGVAGHGKSSLVSKQAQRHLSTRLLPGQYEILVSDEHGFGAISRVITLKARQRLHYSLMPNKPTYPQPVYGGSINSLVADGSQLLFVDGGDNSLKVTSSSSGTLVMLSGPDQNIVSAKWSTIGLGIAEDNNNALYLVSNNALTPIKLPFNNGSNQFLGYDVAKNGQTYIINSKDLYVGSMGNNFKKIYSSSHGFRLVAAATGKVAVASGNVNSQADEGGAATSASTNPGYVTVINSAGKAHEIRWFASSIAWSPDGNYLLVSGASGNAVFDSSLHQVASISVNNVALITWLNNNDLLYSIDSQLWLYSIKTGQSEKLTALAMNDSLTAIYPSSDGSYVYFSADNGEQAEVYRLGLVGQASNNSLTALSIFLPETLGSCHLNYLDFNQPLFLIAYPPGVSAQNCQSLAQGELQTYGLDVSQFHYQLIPEAP
jgi:sugar lactone lactonase YvrE